ncbi:hypothetical protein KCP74_20665 [Salmonella enterica subsp. enterica]|nr:hypothetical protein KCP74_20665 [Salmonella enterica subsp. enterica]
MRTRSEAAGAAPEKPVRRWVAVGFGAARARCRPATITTGGGRPWNKALMVLWATVRYVD